MSRRFPLASLLFVGIFSLLSMTGCGQGEAPQPPAAGGDQAAPVAGEAAEKEYNPHDVPITEEQKQQLRQEAAKFPDAVDRIQQFRVQVEEETKNGIPENPYEAHQALDRVDLVLQWLPEIARDSTVPKENWEEINTTANELRALFEKVHQNIDNKQNPDFASVQQDIDQRIGRLQGIAK